MRLCTEACDTHRQFSTGVQRRLGKWPQRDKFLLPAHRAGAAHAQRLTGCIGGRGQAVVGHQAETAVNPASGAVSFDGLDGSRQVKRSMSPNTMSAAENAVLTSILCRFFIVLQTQTLLNVDEADGVRNEQVLMSGTIGSYTTISDARLLHPQAAASGQACPFEPSSHAPCRPPAARYRCSCSESHALSEACP